MRFLREKGHEMNDRLKERIHEINRRAEMAERDGYTVAEGLEERSLKMKKVDGKVRGRDPMDAVARLALLALQAEVAAAVGAVAMVAGCLAAHMAGLA